jgi:hypothetical protein
MSGFRSSRHNRFTASAVVVSAIFGLFTIVSPAQALIIDQFVTVQDSTTDLAAPPNKTAFSSVAAATALGGERDLLVTKIAGALGDRVRARTNPLAENKLRFSQDDGVRSTAQVVYDGFDGVQAVDPSGLGGLSLLDDGSTGFLLDITGSDVGGPIRIRVIEQGTLTNFIEGTLNAPGGILGSTPLDDITVGLLFTSMTITGTSSLNDILTNVGAIILTIDATGLSQESWDLNVTFFRTSVQVPEPSAIILMMFGLAAIGSTRRRVKR